MKTHSFLLALGAALVLAAVKLFLFPPSPSFMPWHDNEAWGRFLDAYDELKERHFSHCKSRLVPTSFGMTQTHACGHAWNPPVFFFNGAGTDSFLYGNFLLPEVAKDANKYAIAIDYPCDNGRSIPKDGDPQNCPFSETDVALWVEEVAKELHLKGRSISMLGTSFGAWISFVTALKKPRLVDQLILLAPASIFVKLSRTFFFNVLVSFVFPGNATQNFFLRSMSTNTSIDIREFDELEQRHVIGLREVGASKTLKLPQSVYPDETIQEIFKAHRVFVGIGEKDSTMADPIKALNRARDNGATTAIMYPNAGHLLMLEYPTRNRLVKDVVQFFNREHEDLVDLVLI